MMSLTLEMGPTSCRIHVRRVRDDKAMRINLGIRGAGSDDGRTTRGALSCKWLLLSMQRNAYYLLRR